MCGITGIITKTEISDSEIEMMTEIIRHRGPDALGYFKSGKVAFGHRRLSIIDLDARSNQPFFSKDRRYIMVYNGEIFNFKKVADELTKQGIALRTTSDTEVVIEAFALWGPGFIQRLNGMFAFVIYDTLEEKLFLYRDRVGKKPLYYYLKNGLFLFASEMKAILIHPAVASSLTIDHSTISTFLQLGYIPQPKTFYKDIFKFPAGHYGVLSKEIELSILPFWNASHYITTSRPITEASALNELKELVTDAVNSRLIADVPVGIFLSGGIDSSLVTAVASKSAKLKTFSIGFKESKFDESKFAAAVAKHVGTDHINYLLSEKEAVEMVDQYLDHFDEPFADTSAIPTMLVSKLARKEVTVALTGDGGDELFLGYGAYLWADRLNSTFWSSCRPIFKEALQLMPSSRYKRVAHLFDKVDLEKRRRHIFSQEQYFFSEAELKSNVFSRPGLFTEWDFDDARYLAILSEAERQALFDFQYYLRDDLLVKVDRASMFYGLECRSPLLDHRLVEFSVNLPKHLKKQGGVTKYLTKKMLYELVPEKYFDRPKWGFSIPLADWMKNELGYLFNHLDAENLDKFQLFDSSAVSDLKKRFFSGETYLYNRLWALIIVQRFLQLNRL
jgi:asparagine synthase (glutamine-hydrolysing)